MKCLDCGVDNKDTAKTCRKCGRDLSAPPAWQPDALWHVRTLGIIYTGLLALYFGVSSALSTLPRPYHLRHIPVEMTPWLAPGGKVHLDEDQLKAPPPSAAPEKK